MSEVEISEVSLDAPEVRSLLANAVAYLEDLYPQANGFAPLDPRRFAAPLGAFLVVAADGVGLACGGFCPSVLGTDVAEVKRIWVEPAGRRRGLARALLQSLERRAGELGYRRLVLTTGPRQAEAVALYDDAGYERIEPYVEHPGVVSFAKALADLSASAGAVGGS